MRCLIADLFGIDLYLLPITLLTVIGVLLLKKLPRLIHASFTGKQPNQSFKRMAALSTFLANLNRKVLLTNASYLTC